MELVTRVRHQQITQCNNQIYTNVCIHTIAHTFVFVFIVYAILYMNVIEKAKKRNEITHSQ